MALQPIRAKELQPCHLDAGRPPYAATAGGRPRQRKTPVPPRARHRCSLASVGHLGCLRCRRGFLYETTPDAVGFFLTPNPEAMLNGLWTRDFPAQRLRSAPNRTRPDKLRVRFPTVKCRLHSANVALHRQVSTPEARDVLRRSSFIRLHQS